MAILKSAKFGAPVAIKARPNLERLLLAGTTTCVESQLLHIDCCVSADVVAMRLCLWTSVKNQTHLPARFYAPEEL